MLTIFLIKIFLTYKILQKKKKKKKKEKKEQ